MAKAIVSQAVPADRDPVQRAECTRHWLRTVGLYPTPLGEKVARYSRQSFKADIVAGIEKMQSRDLFALATIIERFTWKSRTPRQQKAFERKIAERRAKNKTG